MGCQMCWGTFCGPVGTSCEAKKIRVVAPPSAVFNTAVYGLAPSAANAPDALLTAPISALPEAAFAQNCMRPMILRISSRPHAPALSLCPSAQARKGEVQNNNPQPSKEIL